MAKKFSSPTAPLTEDDVIITSGGAHALDMSICVLANQGDNILLPCPGFPHYATLAQHKGIECRYYNLQPDNHWEVDLQHLRSLIDSRTKALLINNPSNPCGSVFRKQHIIDILAVAEEFNIPVISDEIYASMIFDPSSSCFHACADLNNSVPILTVSGLSKCYLVPGWRLGWILIHDRNNKFEQVRKGLVNLSQLIVGPNAIIQGALERILVETPPEFHRKNNQHLADNAVFLADRISTIRGLSFCKPEGGMYMMIGIDKTLFPEFENDVAFCKCLLMEENLFVLPGTLFGAPNFFRIILPPPQEMLVETCDRLELFCTRHRA